MGRRRRTWQELKNSGCKPGRWQKRQREELGEIGANEAITAYLREMNRECATFAERLAAGEVIMRDLNGNKFDFFAEDHWFTQVCAFAKNSLADPACGEWTHELCTRFLADLDNSATHGYYLDPVAIESAKAMYAIWQTPATDLNYLRLLAVIEFLSWKKPDGELRFADEELLKLNPLDIAVIDKMIRACQTTEEMEA